MAINLTITEDSQQIVFGIPISITVVADQPCIIFYTLDNSDPDLNSNVYIDSLILPRDQTSVIVKLFATNTLDQSEIITRTYAPDMTALRQPRDMVEGNYPDDVARYNSFPYSSFSPTLPINYLGPSVLGIVDDPAVPNIPDGYDSEGELVLNIDHPFQDYPLIYTETDASGRRGPGIGNLPHKTTPVPPATSPNTIVNLFDPRAHVIIMDGRKPFPQGFTQINRENFSIQNIERFSDGNLVYTTGEEGNRPSGTSFRAHWNPRNNTITYYYHDQRSNKWIISIEPYSKRLAVNENLAQTMVGNPRVFKWTPFFWRGSPY